MYIYTILLLSSLITIVVTIIVNCSYHCSYYYHYYYYYHSVYRQNSLANKHANPNSFVPGSSSIALDAEPVHHLLDVVPVVSCIVENKPIFGWLFIYLYI